MARIVDANDRRVTGDVDRYVTTSWGVVQRVVQQIGQRLCHEVGLQVDADRVLRRDQFQIDGFHQGDVGKARSHIASQSDKVGGNLAELAGGLGVQATEHQQLLHEPRSAQR